MTADGVKPDSKSPIPFDIYSDGGGEVATTAAAACIIDDRHAKRRYRLVAFLGGATNNEGEIFAGLMAFALVETLTQSDQRQGPLAVQWHSDSEYALKSACNYIRSWQANGWKTSSKQAVKNQGLWRVYLDLSKDISVIPKHVRGHSGHPENEECDTASTWVRNKGLDLLGEDCDNRALSVQISGNRWIMFDARAILRSFRDTCPAVQEIRKLVTLVADLAVKDGDRKEQIVGGTVPATHYSPSEKYYLLPTLSLLRQAQSEAERNKGRSNKLEELSTKIGELIKDFSN